MASQTANGIRIEYETTGDRSGEPLLLIPGLAAQLTLWAESFCDLLADRGLYVIRMDNRDAGLSESFDGVPPTSIEAFAEAAQRGEVLAAYTLSDMAADAVGLLDALSIPAAHVAGASLGAAIAQVVTIEHPDRVRSLISIMSGTGAPDLPPADPAVRAWVTVPVATERDPYVDQQAAMWRALSGDPERYNEAEVREYAASAYDRSFRPEGLVRQVAANRAYGSRRAAPEVVTAPTLVIHGREDPLAPLSHGIDVAAAVDGAEMLVLDGLGHELPSYFFEQVADAIVGHTRRVAAARS